MKNNFQTAVKIATQALLFTNLVLFAGCAKPAETSNLRVTQTNNILNLYEKGNLTAEQAINMVAAINDRELIRQEMSNYVQPQANSSTTIASAAPVTASANIVSNTKADAYQPELFLSGRLRSIGSDTLDNLMASWELDFKRYHPSIRFYHEGKGSSTAPPAILESRADFGPMSRSMKDSEIQAFSDRYGYEPTALRVAIDALAVYVHPSNPIAQQGLSLQQLDAIFSENRNRGSATAITTWGQLGLTGEFANAPIKVYSRNNASGTYGFFKKSVLLDGDYISSKIEFPGSEQLVSAVAQDKFGIGYSGIAYNNPSVATVPLSANPGGEVYPPEDQYAYSDDYPLARYMYLTLNHQPGSTAEPLHKEFTKYIFSLEGQNMVSKEGFFRVSSKIADEELAKLN